MVREEIDMSRGMTADEAFDAPEEHFPRRDVLRILRDHGVETEEDGLEDFFDELGRDATSYSLAAVLLWLGY
jgi:hypothetical protein